MNAIAKQKTKFVIKSKYTNRIWYKKNFDTPRSNIYSVFKGDSNPNDKYISSEKALWTINFDTSIIKIGWKMGKLWAFKKFNMANI